MAVYPPFMVALCLYRWTASPRTTEWVIQDPPAVSAWFVSCHYFLSASLLPSSISFVPLITCPRRHILPEPCYAELFTAALIGSAFNSHVGPR